MKISLKTAITLFVILLIIIGVILGVVIRKGKTNNIAENANQENTVDLAAEEENNFDISFLQMENNQENMIYSPLSIKYALNMLNDGADGNTKAQIESLVETVNLPKYENISESLAFANGVYIRKTYAKKIKSEYKDLLEEKYNAEINYDSFNDASNINNWIEKKTLRIIKNMVKDEVVQNPDTKMLLINALAIDMEWENEFKDNDTTGEKFYLENGDEFTATTMHQETSSDNVSYYKGEDATVLTMDLKKYDDTQLEFIAIMPEEDLSDYINNFKVSDANKIIEKTKKASETKNGIKVSIPKFSFQYDLKLKKDLIEMGITDAFDEELADFSNMDEDNNLFVGDALHKANIDFTEEGVKASAVTVIVMMTKGLAVNEDEPEEVKIDKPFLFLIRDKENGETWFAGTVYQPNSWETDKADYTK